MSATSYHQSEGPSSDGTSHESASQPRNPLLCFLCDDYYSDPCLLNCFHTFCSRCLQTHVLDGKVACPLCGQQTPVKEGSTFAPPDMLMRQLIELVNAENPPCSNCDKRDKPSMYFCSTCGQALCNHCRENTHRAKMFSTHEVVHMSKYPKEGHRRCGVHGEQYIMFSNTQKNMLCVNCFRDTPAEARLHCVDIDTAYTQGTRKLEKAVVAVCDLQTSVKEGMLVFSNLLDELRHNMESEKQTINSFCQGMQEAIAKTHASMIMEVQRQFETKERQFRTQLMSLSSVLPLLQLHLLLCSSFTNSASKHQFLDLAYPMMDRLAAVSQLSHPLRPVQSSQIRTNYRNEFSHSLEPWVGKAIVQHQKLQQTPAKTTSVTEGGTCFDSSQTQSSVPVSSSAGLSHVPTHYHAAPSKRQQSALRVKALEGEGPFSNHCRSFDSQFKDLSKQLASVKERLSELHRDVMLLRRANTPPLINRYEHVVHECSFLEEQLERSYVELERLKNVFDTLWEEQLCRIHVEQDIFQSQMNDISTLRSEVKQMNNIAHQLEPFIKRFTDSEGILSQCDSDAAENVVQGSSQQKLQSLIEHLNLMQMDPFLSYRVNAPKKGECYMHPNQGITSPTLENMMYMKVDGKETPVREFTQSRAGRGPVKVLVNTNLVCPAKESQFQHEQQLPFNQQTPPIHLQTVTSQPVPFTEYNRDSKRGVLSQLIEKVRTKEDRKKSPIQEDARNIVSKDRSKSDGRSSCGDNIHHRGSAPQEDVKQISTASGTKIISRGGKSDTTATRYGSSRESSSKVASLYHTISGKMLGSKETERSEVQNYGIELGSQPGGSGSHSDHHKLPPPPPPIRRPHSHHQDSSEKSEIASGISTLEMRERIDSVKEKISETLGRSVQHGRMLRHITTSNKTSVIGTENYEYQRISEATTSPVSDKNIGAAMKQVRALVHREPNITASTPPSPHHHRDTSGKIVRVYPSSDTEDTVFFSNDETERFRKMGKKHNNSCESLALSTVSVNSRRSSVDFGDRKTLVVVIGSSSKGTKARLMQKQRSWETFPPKKRVTSSTDHQENYRKFCRDPNSFRGGFELKPHTGNKDMTMVQSNSCTLKKADSFEGHEEAVRTLVAAVQETRSQQMQQQRKLHTKSGSN